MFKLMPEKIGPHTPSSHPRKQVMVELPPTASAVRKFIDKNMWQKARELTETTQERKLRKKRLTMRIKIGLLKCRSSLGPSRAIVPSLAVFQGKKTARPATPTKNTKKTKDPSKTLEMSIVGLMVSSQPGSA